MTKKPTIVFVHGAFTDASAWNGVSARLQDMGYSTLAPAVPLRSFNADAEYLSAYLAKIDGPMVLVGHSYGGSLISHPAVGRHCVQALVFVAAFVPDAGESMGELNGRFPGSQLGDATTILREHPGGNDLYLRTEHFSGVYAADLPDPVVALMAASQRPLNVTALSEVFEGEPTWRHLPSWTVIATADQSLPAEAQRFMAERAGSVITEISASHALPLSQPGSVAEVIAAAATGAAESAE